MPYINYEERFELYQYQSLTLSKKTGMDNYGKPTYTDSTITGRKVGKLQLVKDINGREIVSKTEVTTTADVTAEDKIDGEIVISVLEAVDKFGVVSGRKIFL